MEGMATEIEKSWVEIDFRGRTHRSSCGSECGGWGKERNQGFAEGGASFVDVWPEQQPSLSQAGSDLGGGLLANLDPDAEYIPVWRLQSLWGGPSTTGWGLQTCGKGALTSLLLAGAQHLHFTLGLANYVAGLAWRFPAWATRRLFSAIYQNRAELGWGKRYTLGHV